MSHQVKGYSELGRMAVALGIDDAYALWLCLRAWDTQGRGLIRYDSNLLDRLGEWFELGQRRTLWRYLAKGEGIFWQRSGGFIVLRGLAQLTSMLVTILAEKQPNALLPQQYTQQPAGRPVLLDVIGLAAKSTRRAAFFGAWVSAGQKGQRIVTLEKLALWWGVSVRTVWEWGEWPAVRKSANWVTFAREQSGQAPAVYAPAHAQMMVTADGPCLYWRGPSAYQVVPPSCPRGMARHLGKRISRNGSPVTIPGDGQPTALRLFWLDLKAAAKRAQHNHFTISEGPRVSASTRCRGRWWEYRQCLVLQI